MAQFDFISPSWKQ